MTAFKNLIHAIVLAAWAGMGVLLSLKCVFGAGASLSTLAVAGGFWLWFVGFAAATTAVTSRLKTPLATLGAHAAIIVFLNLLPRALWLLRYGLDVLRFA